MTYWYAVNSKAHQESEAEINLKRLGVEAFCPLLKQTKLIRRVRKTVIGPMFPGYLFVSCDLSQQYRAVSFAKGVRKIVAFGLTPAEVDEELIQAIKGRLRNGYVTLESNLPKPGDVVRLQGGPFSGLNAVFEREMTGSQRAVLLLKMLSGHARVIVPVEQVANL